MAALQHVLDDRVDDGGLDVSHAVRDTWGMAFTPKLGDRRGQQVGQALASLVSLRLWRES